jgi:lipoate-protein ligase A
MDVNLIIDGALTGEENMERDEALLAGGIPALRFYRWSPPCVSIGYFQNPARDIDLEFLRREGIDLVRRPTGGRAVLHEDEITYAVVLPESLLPAGVVPSYRRLADVFLAALNDLGVRGELKGPEGRPDRSGSCFASASAYEITVEGRKVIGSAQVRRNGVVLQHGSILLAVDYERQAGCLKGPSAIAALDLRLKMAGLEEWLGQPVDPRRIIDAVCVRFTRATGLALSPSSGKPGTA